MQHVQRPRPSRPTRTQGSARPARLGQMADASPVVSQLAAFQAQADGRSVVQRVINDAGGVAITVVRVQSEGDVTTLKAWQSLIEGLDLAWDDDDFELADDLRDAISARLEALGLAEAQAQAQAEAQALAQAQAEAQAKETARVRALVEKQTGPLPNYDAAVQAGLAMLPSHQQGKFFSRCAALGTVPSVALGQVEAGVVAGSARKAALAGFAEGDFDLVTAIAHGAARSVLAGLNRSTGGLADTIAANIKTGILTVAKITYKDTPLGKGSVFVFSFALGGDRLDPEWHVHWGSGNKVDASSFKAEKDRKKVGQGVRTVTGASEIATLRGAIDSGLWG